MKIGKDILAIGFIGLFAIFMTGRSESNAHAAPMRHSANHAHAIAQEDGSQRQAATRKPIKKVLFIGDSMTGWLSERLNAYGELNGFDVSTIVWDGSTISKWGDTAKLKAIIDKEQPDAIFMSLGMNELFERNPQANLSTDVDNILKAFGDTPYLWVGPPSWPGKSGGETLNKWLENKLGSDHYFNSSSLNLSRQSKMNPHPTRDGMVKWMDTIIEWLPTSESNIKFESLSKPGSSAMSRGKTFIYKKMKETL